GQMLLMPDLVDRQDRRVAQLRDAARFTEEAVPIGAVADLRSARHLDGDDAVEFRVQRLVHQAEGALADEVEELESADHLVGSGAPVDRGFALHGETGAARGARDFGIATERGNLDRVLTLGAQDLHGEILMVPFRLTIQQSYPDGAGSKKQN